MTLEKMSELKKYKQRPIEVHAFRWTPKVGKDNGVQARPKKHVMNPDEFYIKNRFGVEEVVTEGDWIVKDASSGLSIVKDFHFLELYYLEGEEALPRKAPVIPLEAPEEPEEPAGESKAVDPMPVGEKTSSGRIRKRVNK